MSSLEPPRIPPSPAPAPAARVSDAQGNPPPSLTWPWKIAILSALALSATALLLQLEVRQGESRSPHAAATAAPAGTAAPAAASPIAAPASDQSAESEESTASTAAAVPTHLPPPADIQRYPVLTLGKAVLLFMPNSKPGTLAWDHLAEPADRPPVVWLDDPFVTLESDWREGERTVRRGVARIWMSGQPSTELRTTKRELWWGVQLESPGEAREGIDAVRLWPGFPERGSCWSGITHQGCVTDPVKDLRAAGVQVRQICQRMDTTPWTKVYVLSHPGKRDTVLVEELDAGSSGASGSLTLALGAQADDLC